MAHARFRRSLFVVSLAVAGVAAASSAGADASSIASTAGGQPAEGPAVVRTKPSFPCRWRFDLEAGLRTGYVTAGNSADCRGRQGSLTLSVRLFRLDPASKTWRVLRGNHFFELATPCVVSTVRAVFGWTLRNTGGTVVGRHSLRTASLKVPGPDCKIGIG